MTARRDFESIGLEAVDCLKERGPLTIGELSACIDQTEAVTSRALHLVRRALCNAKAEYTIVQRWSDRGTTDYKDSVYELTNDQELVRQWAGRLIKRASTLVGTAETGLTVVANNYGSSRTNEARTARQEAKGASAWAVGLAAMGDALQGLNVDEDITLDA